MKIIISAKEYEFEYNALEHPRVPMVDNSKFKVSKLCWEHISYNVREHICNSINANSPIYSIVDVEGMNAVGLIQQKSTNKLFLLIEPMYGTIETLKEMLMLIEAKISCINLFEMLDI